MARNVLVDAGFLVALLNARDSHHVWAAAQAAELPPPWSTCESVLSEAYHLLGDRGHTSVSTMLRRRALVVSFHLSENIEPVSRLIEKYSNIPMSLADACLVRMTESLADPLLLTTDSDFRLYRRHSRQVVPCLTPNS
ncbi:MAG TPA: PIN domain-containing protein [Candidatus Acidoferrum sp.]|nr:PIN domain-containing protein [Candidatus Acidoferrum sp.]